MQAECAPTICDHCVIVRTTSNFSRTHPFLVRLLTQVQPTPTSTQHDRQPSHPTAPVHRVAKELEAPLPLLPDNHRTATTARPDRLVSRAAAGCATGLHDVGLTSLDRTRSPSSSTVSADGYLTLILT